MRYNDLLGPASDKGNIVHITPKVIIMSFLLLFVTVPIKALLSIATSVALSGSLLALLTSVYGEELLTKRLDLSSDIVLQRARITLLVLFSFNALREVNNALNRWAMNNWHIAVHSKWDWKEEIAVVTGGCSGIGEKLVDGLAERGVKVAVLDIQELPVALQNRDNVRFYRCDVTSSDSIAAAASSIRTDLGHPSIVINNAGVLIPSTILETPEPILRKVFSINCFAHWSMAQEFLPRMIELNKGHVVTVASMSSFLTVPTCASYAATKAGILAFHEALTSELKHFHRAPGVLTTIVHPNVVYTPLIEKVVTNANEKSPKMLKREDVANLILAQVWSGRGAQLVIPSTERHLSGLKAWPMWLQEIVRDAVGKGVAETHSLIECGIRNGDIDQKGCGKDNSYTYTVGYDYDSGTNIDLYGIDLNARVYSWAPEEDNRGCIASAIRKATCNTVSLDDFNCWKRS
ncbi:hypothetical protein BX600DRAFT_555058 [Xylariales sp. PMI_506]|nr:hypothetical protein BX600DRAFT_555058 [Xylariales sp. PMI_506]